MGDPMKPVRFPQPAQRPNGTGAFWDYAAAADAFGSVIDGLTAPEDMSLRDALSLMLVEGKERLTVLDGEGSPKGTLALEAITRLIGPDERAAKA